MTAECRWWLQWRPRHHRPSTSRSAAAKARNAASVTAVVFFK